MMATARSSARWTNPQTMRSHGRAHHAHIAQSEFKSGPGAKPLLKAIAGKFRRNFRVQRLRCRNIRVAGTGIASLQFSISATIQGGWHFGIEPQCSVEISNCQVPLTLRVISVGFYTGR
jgi:hypothetical protein